MSGTTSLDAMLAAAGIGNDAPKQAGEFTIADAMRERPNTSRATIERGIKLAVASGLFTDRETKENGRRVTVYRRA